MMDLFDLYAKISLDDGEFQKGIADAGSKFKSFAGGMGTVASKGLELGKQLTGAIDKIGQTAVSAFGKVTAGAGTVLAGIGALGKMAVDGFADYEQLTGGVETLFKSSADAVMGYAQNAYKTAGMSANEYMETVTSFSASLLQSLGGDTAKAADKADQAITDMADNANKMGSSMESVQNAYQGFAKQNYTINNLMSAA